MKQKAAAALSVLAACLALSGCAVEKGFRAAPMMAKAAPAGDAHQYTDRDIREAFGAQAQLALPAKLAVYEATSQDTDYDVRDNETIESIMELLEDEEKFYQIVVLSPTFIPGASSRHRLSGAITPLNLRRAAASHRADLTLLCESDFRVKVEGGLLRVLDVTILGAFVVPSQTIEIEHRVTAHLVDTRNGLVYHSTLKKKTWRGRSASAFGKDTVQERRKELAKTNYEAIAKDVRANLRHVARLASQPIPAPLPRPSGLPIRRPRQPVPRWRDAVPTPVGRRYETPGAE